MKFDLSYIKPARATFELNTVPGKIFSLRPVSINDQTWMHTTFGEKLEGIFKSGNFVELLRIAYHQLEKEDQQFFLKKSVEFINEDGEKLESSLGGVKLFHSLIEGPNEALKVVEALMKTIGISQPLIDELEKKSLTESNPIGPMSATDSVPSTVGLPITS